MPCPMDKFQQKRSSKRLSNVFTWIYWPVLNADNPWIVSVVWSSVVHDHFSWAGRAFFPMNDMLWYASVPLVFSLPCILCFSLRIPFCNGSKYLFSSVKHWTSVILWLLGIKINFGSFLYSCSEECHEVEIYPRIRDDRSNCVTLSCHVTSMSFKEHVNNHCIRKGNWSRAFFTQTLITAWSSPAPVTHRTE